MGLEKHIQEIRAAFEVGSFESEAAVSQGVVLRLLSALGWPAYNTQTVIPQYIVERTRVDYALCHPPSKPIAFIEVKNIGKSKGAERQLFQYAFHEGLPTICQQLLRGYNPAIKFQLNAMRRVHVLGNLDQKSVGL